jgi:hypothetical protein
MREKDFTEANPENNYEYFVSHDFYKSVWWG